MPRRKPRRRSPGDPPAAPERPAIPTLDLHGETAEAALRRTRAWLESQRGPGSRSVRVVTGRGAHSAGPPVLRGEVAGLLAALQGGTVREWVLEVSGGAFRIEISPLRRSRPAGSRPAAEDAAEAELRRRAEADLWEIGVTPTPELVRAEMRRLRDSPRQD